MSKSSSIVHVASIREFVCRGLVEFCQPIYLFIRNRKKPWAITQDDLAAFSEGTLGRDLHRFLAQNNIELIPKVEFHDLFHVLFDLDISIKGESSIQFVLVGNGKRSWPYLMVASISFLMYPEHWEDFRKAFYMGKNADRFYDLNFEQVLHLQISTFRKLYGIRKLSLE